MSDEKDNLSPEKIVIGANSEGEKAPEKESSRELEPSFDDSKNFEKTKERQKREESTEKLDLSKEGEGELGGIVSAGNLAKKKSLQLKKIEDIMSNDLRDTYIAMSPDMRLDFRKKGEYTAQKINEILSKTKVKVRKIIDLLKKWLSMIPNVNKYFIEQEAKIKTDELLALKNKENK